MLLVTVLMADGENIYPKDVVTMTTVLSMEIVMEIYDAVLAPVSIVEIQDISSVNALSQEDLTGGVNPVFGRGWELLYIYTFIYIIPENELTQK